MQLSMQMSMGIVAVMVVLVSGSTSHAQNATDTSYRIVVDTGTKSDGTPASCTATEAEELKLMFEHAKRVLEVIVPADVPEVCREWTTVTNANTLGGLVDDDVRAIAFDKAGGKWIGTNEGVSHRSANNIWTRYTTANGLVDNEVYAIATDSAGGKRFGSMPSPVVAPSRNRAKERNIKEV